MKTEKYLCDIKDCTNEATHKGIGIQIIFTTEQTEGRSVKPYLENVRIDMCEKCMEAVLQGNYIFANGAQGYNEYKMRQ